jgi:hypothetical protein
MKKRAALMATFSLLVLWTTPSIHGQGEIRIWKEFVEMLKENRITLDRIRPLEFVSKETQVEVLNSFIRNAVWKEWEVEPEVLRYDNHVNFVIPLKGKYGEWTHYCFMFLVEEDKWYYRHVEAIFIRLDKISAFPVSEFPDLPEDKKAWMREEIMISEHVRLFNMLTREKGKDFALDWFKRGVGNGPGYFLAAKAWVPFVPPPKAFILYVCWEQANLIGNEVTLQKLDENEAVVKMIPLNFQVFRHATHLKRQVAFQDYRKIYETIWKHRAQSAGWDLLVDIRGVECIFRFKRINTGQVE